MATLSNIVPTAGSDGLTYATAVPLTATEADLGDGLLAPAPIATTYGEAILAIVQLSANGIIVANTSYVVMQVELADGVWVDACWCLWTGNQGSATFVFSNGIAGANVFQHSRGVGQPPTPQANGSNQITLGGRIRFVGKSIFSGGSSSVSGTPTRVSATIKYRLLPLR